MRLPCFALALVVAACSGDPRSEVEPSGPPAAGTDGDPASNESTADAPDAEDDADPSADGTTGNDADDASGGDPIFDVPSGDSIPGVGCQKVDFVFVVDASGSMLDEQAALEASFPAFRAEIEDTLELDDFRLMVLDTGATPGGGAPCDFTLGAGRTHDGAGADCGLDGARYVDGSVADLDAAFTCMASVGTQADGNERTMDALLSGLGSQTLPGGCNEGFVRDDAILVVTIITDEEDAPDDIQDLPSVFPPYHFACAGVDDDPNSSGDPESWREELVALKNGDEDAVVLLALIGDCDLGGCEPVTIAGEDGSVVTGAEPAPRLRALANSFAHGSTGPICAADYAPFFSDAVSIIDTACDEFEPEG